MEERLRATLSADFDLTEEMPVDNGRNAVPRRDRRNADYRAAIRCLDGTAELPSLEGTLDDALKAVTRPRMQPPRSISTTWVWISTVERWSGRDDWRRMISHVTSDNPALDHGYQTGHSRIWLKSPDDPEIGPNESRLTGRRWRPTKPA